MHKNYYCAKSAAVTAIGILLYIPLISFASEPATTETEEGYVVIEKPASDQEIVILEHPAEEKLQSCITQLTPLRAQLTPKTDAIVAPFFTQLAEEKPTLPEKISHAIATLETLREYVALLLGRASPEYYAELQATYKANFEKVGLTAHQVYSYVGLKTNHDSPIPLETIKQKIKQKEESTLHARMQEQEKLKSIRQELLELRIAQAQQERLIESHSESLTSSVHKKKEREITRHEHALQSQMEAGEKHVADLEKELSRLRQIDFIFRNALSKESFDAYLQGKGAVEKIKVSTADQGALLSLLTTIQECKAELSAEMRKLKEASKK